MTGLTPRQAEVLRFIERHGTLSGAPSYTEIAKHLGLKSKSGIHRIVSALKLRGKIEDIPGRPRSIGLVAGQPVLRDELDHALRAHARKQRTTPTALLNEIVADYLGISSDGGVIG